MGKKASIKLETGTVYQKEEDGTYYFRYQVQHERKCVSLKTKSQVEAIQKAKDLLPIVKATNAEVISAHVQVARKLAMQAQSLPLTRVWEVYSNHEQRALPATVREELSYEGTWNEFLCFLDPKLTDFSDVTPNMAVKFAEHLKTTGISVSTHNRKIVRLRKVFETLKEYYAGSNPFALPVLRRKVREEQGSQIRRIAFTREQEDAIRRELDNPKRLLMNKAEIKVIYYIGMYTGQRLKDCVLMQWQNIDMTQRRIWVKQFKTGKEVSIPIADPLEKVLQNALAWKVDPYVCPKVAARYLIVDQRGKSVGDGMVNIDVMRVIRWIGLETCVAVPGRKRKSTVYGFHSLRHSFASHCAEAGVPKAVVVSILGANSDIIDRFYTHVGEDAQRAAIDAITGNGGGITDRERIKNALAFMATLTETPEILRLRSILTEA